MADNFQTEVRREQGFGVIGVVRLDSPHRANSAYLNSPDAANNVIGRFFTYTDATATNVEAGDPGAAGQVPAGFLVAPKTYALQGTAAGTLEPSLQLPNNTQVELLVEGDIIVEVTTASEVGHAVYYSEADGTLVTDAPGAGVPAGTQPCYAEVIRYQAATAAQPGLALIHVDKFPPIA